MRPRRPFSIMIRVEISSVESGPLPPSFRDVALGARLEKAGLTTPQAVHDIARALNVRRHDIGAAPAQVQLYDKIRLAVVKIDRPRVDLR